MSNAGGFKSLVRYYDMLAGNTTWSPWSPTGAYESIATITTGGASTYSFTSIPSTYKHLQIRAIVGDAAGADFRTLNITFNSDTGSNYSNHYLTGDGSSASSGGGSASNAGSLFATSAGAPSYGVTPSVVDILDYANTSKYKTVRLFTGVERNTTPSLMTFWSGNWRSTSAITRIDLTSNGGTMGTVHIALYGIK